jgi:hypothetical protein
METPEAAVALYGLGGVAEAQGDSTQAKSYYQRAFDIRVEIFGETHPKTIECGSRLS